MSDREYQVAGLRDAVACYPADGDCVIINCANCRIKELESGREWTSWISVKDELPEENQIVLTIDLFDGHSPMYDLLSVSPELLRQLEAGDPDSWLFSHWMPMPIEPDGFYEE